MTEAQGAELLERMADLQSSVTQLHADLNTLRSVHEPAIQALFFVACALVFLLAVRVFQKG